MKKYTEYKSFDLTDVANKQRENWKQAKVFDKSIKARRGAIPWVFFEGPPSANGKPGIHHVMGRTIKDLFCRYQTLKGKLVERKAGWDTHGLPVELGVEKELKITKEDIGKTISVAEYNKACRQAVMQYTDMWNDLTDKMGYWVDMESPYVTYKTKYIESVWWLLKQLSQKDLLYKGYTIQPYSPAAGTGLSSHEVNMPGCYRNVKDNTVVAQFKVKKQIFTISALAEAQKQDNLFLLAWTTTPWTLPSNTALTVGPKIKYVLVKTYNQYTNEPIQVILAENLVSKVFSSKFNSIETEEDLNAYQKGDKKIPYLVKDSFLGADLVNIKYEQLLPYTLPMDNPEEAFRVIPGAFVTTEDGTGIVHTAPTFGADDAKVANDAGVPAMLIADEEGNPVPLVDLRGRFLDELNDEVFGLGGEYVKAEYLSEEERETSFEKQKELLKHIIPNLKAYLSVDERIALKLKLENRAFKIEKYEHSYPHCWRTDKPVLYYPLDSWFVRSTAKKERMIELNKTINWKPKSTGEGRFGNWLENLNDWNLSRSRYWGIPLPVWTSEDGSEMKVIGSVEELIKEIDIAVHAGVMESNPYAGFEVGNMSEENYEKVDLHRPNVDDIKLVSEKGSILTRETDLIDVWFDSGSMPYAQLHYPFENKALIDERKNFPADFIAEGVDQTRGWFFTLHAISTMVFDSVAYKNVVSNGLVLDKKGQKMSKSKGNGVEPFEALAKYSPDAVRWYMITNAQPWDNLKFDLDGVTETQRKFFRALHNTYAFFALYANVDGFAYNEEEIKLEDRPELDQWILSKLHSLTKLVDEAYEAFEPTRAGRLIQEFVVDNLSNWHVRLSRKRFWRGDYTHDKISAYQTLWTCLEAISIMASPIAPFYSDQLYVDLHQAVNKGGKESVHLADFPSYNQVVINPDLETRMGLAQQVSSSVLALRKKEGIRVRQPLQKIMIPVLNQEFEGRVKAVEELIKTEVNIKKIDYLKDTEGVLVKKIKPNFATLGRKYKALMKGIASQVNQMDQKAISEFEQKGSWKLIVNEEEVSLDINDVIISTDDIPGWLVAVENGMTVALDITITDSLRHEGIARELINRIQNHRKEAGFEVTDKINVKLLNQELITPSVSQNFDYICSETLIETLDIVDDLEEENKFIIELEEEVSTEIFIVKS